MARRFPGEEDEQITSTIRNSHPEVDSPTVLKAQITSAGYSTEWDSMIKKLLRCRGAHNLGRCHSDRSGFEGAWVNNPTRFSNQYFRLLLSLQWKKKTLKNGVEQFVNYDEDTETELMMLPTDIGVDAGPKFQEVGGVICRGQGQIFRGL